MKTCAGCPNPAACAKAGKCLMEGKKKMAKGGMAKKAAAGVAIMIAMPAKAKGKGKTKMAMGGCATKKK
jgi:hypothetical protein